MLTTLAMGHEGGNSTKSEIRLGGHFKLGVSSKLRAVAPAFKYATTCQIQSLLLLPLFLFLFLFCKRPLLCIHRPHHILRLPLLYREPLSCSPLSRSCSTCTLSHPLTDQCVYCLLCLSLQFGKLLLRFPLEIPVRPFGRNVEYILPALSRARCRRVLLPTSSWVLRRSSSAIIFSATPSTSFSTVSWVNPPFVVCFLNVRVSGSKLRFSSRDPLRNTLANVGRRTTCNVPILSICASLLSVSECNQSHLPRLRCLLQRHGRSAD